jgi:Zn-dependent protease with chaperone function
MDFFEHQDNAKKHTSRLIAMLAGVILAITLAIYALSIGVKTLYKSQEEEDTRIQITYWHPTLFSLTLIGTTLVVGIGTTFKILQLQKNGGEQIAQLVNGGFLPAKPSLQKEVQLRNVIEEMALACGCPVPKIYLIDSPFINAFAAGNTPEEAVIGITQGCLDKLSRDELQAIVAHEFSHILHGDMKQNLTLIGILHGILMISIIGEIFMRTRGRRNPLPLIGLVLALIGSLGVIAATLIKQAICRQKEYLADASAVQFTRNPEGVASALKKILQEHTTKTRIIPDDSLSHPKCKEMNHLFISTPVTNNNNLLSSGTDIWLILLGLITIWAFHITPGIGAFLIAAALIGAYFVSATLLNQKPIQRLFDTHPPLNKRIERILGTPFVPNESIPSIKPKNVIDKYLTSNPAKPNSITEWTKRVNPNLFELAHKTETATPLLLSLLSSTLSECTKLPQEISPENQKTFEELIPQTQKLSPEDFLPLAELGLSTLKTLPPSSQKTIQKLSASLLENASATEIYPHILGSFLNQRIQTIADTKTNPLQSPIEAIGVILSILCQIGHPNSRSAPQQAYLEALNYLKTKLPHNHEYPPEEILEKRQCNPQILGPTLVTLRQSPTSVQKALLGACGAAIEFDGVIKPVEIEMLRAIGALLGLPTPPLQIQTPNPQTP